MSKTQGEKGSSYVLGAGRRTSENCTEEEEEEEEGQTLAWALPSSALSATVPDQYDS